MESVKAIQSHVSESNLKCMVINKFVDIEAGELVEGVCK